MHVDSNSLRTRKAAKLALCFFLGVLPASQTALAQDAAQAVGSREKSETDRWREDLRFLDQAIEVFKMNVAAFPQSANVWDSLGEAYRAKGDPEAAIRNYQKALELDPNQRSAIEALRILLGK
jgi:tetratricopeptide (TPR) repeat protein